MGERHDSTAAHPCAAQSALANNVGLSSRPLFPATAVLTPYQGTNSPYNREHEHEGGYGLNELGRRMAPRFCLGVCAHGAGRAGGLRVDAD